MYTQSDKVPDNFTIRLIKLIEQKESNDALQMMRSLKLISSRLVVLCDLVTRFEHEIESVLGIRTSISKKNSNIYTPSDDTRTASDHTHTADGNDTFNKKDTRISTSEIANVRTLTVLLNSVRDLNRYLIRARNFAIAYLSNYVDANVDLIDYNVRLQTGLFEDEHILENYLIFAGNRAINLAYANAKEIEKDISRLPNLNNSYLYTYSDVIIQTLNQSDTRIDLPSDVLENNEHFNELLSSRYRLNASRTFYFTLNGINSLHPKNLSNVVSPYIEAIVNLQHIISDLKDQVFLEPRIISISQNSPLGIELTTNVSDAVDIARRLSTSEGRELAREADRLGVKDSQAEIAIKEAQALETQANELKIREEAKAVQADIELKLAQAQQLRAQAGQISAEADKTRFEIEKARIELGLTLLKELGPNLSDVQKTHYLMRLMQPLGVLIESPLRPDNLPES